MSALVPPALCAQVGKSTLIKCLVKHYTKQNLSEVKGPITVVAGESGGCCVRSGCMQVAVGAMDVDCSVHSPKALSISPCERW